MNGNSEAIRKHRCRRKARLLHRMKTASTRKEATRLAIILYRGMMKLDGGPGSGRYPKGSGNNKPDGKRQSLPMTGKEKEKVRHNINDVYSKYKGKRSCYIETSSNEPDSPSYIYRFKNHGFDNYEIYSKEEYEGGH